jgi:cyclase
LKISLLANKLILYFFLFAAGTCLIAVGSGAGADSPLIKLNDAVYARIVSADGDAVGNSGFVILDKSVLVFDTHFTPEAGAALLADIRAATAKPVRYVVNSHWHADHTHGNQMFADAQIIGSANARRDILQIDIPSLNRTLSITQSQLQKLRQEMAKTVDKSQLSRFHEQIKARADYVQTMSNLKVIPPVVVLDDSLTIQEGKQESRILFLGTGHTDGDVVLFLPEQKIAFTGDLFFNKAIPNVQDANILEWMKTLGEVVKLNADKFIPGHGPIGSRNDVEEFLHYFEALKGLVQAAMDRGAGLEETTREIQVPEKYSSYQFQNFFPSNVQKMFSEIKVLQTESEPVIEPSKTDPKKSAKQK